MSNSRRYRRAGVHAVPPAHVVEAAEKQRCPDCHSQVTLRRHDGMWMVAIAHDDYCPQYTFRRRHQSTSGWEAFIRGRVMRQLGPGVGT